MLGGEIDSGMAMGGGGEEGVQGGATTTKDAWEAFTTHHLIKNI